VVYRSNKDNTTVCGCYLAPEAEPVGSFAGRVAIKHNCLDLPVAQAFEETLRYAESKGVSAIWINDPDHLFDPEQSW
jgi:hypothetical protein